MIYGVGTDIINSNRIKKIIKKYNERFINKFFGKDEIEISKKKYNKNLFFSKRFAAKEAFWKACSPLKSGSIKFKDVQIISDYRGKPKINISGDTLKYIEKIEKSINNKFHFDVSLSDEPPYALAFVIIFLASNQ